MIRESKRGLTSVYRWYFLLIIAILLFSAIVEIFIFNGSYFIYGDQEINLNEISVENIKELGDDRYKILNSKGVMVIENINAFVNNLEFKSDSFGNNVNLSIAFNGKTIKSNINITNKKSIHIGEEVDSIEITLEKKKNKEILLDDFVATNYFQFNPIRYITVVFALLSVFGFVIANKRKLRLELVFLLLIFSFGIANVFLTPVFYSWDEAEHFLKAYNLSEGNLIMDEDEKVSYPKELNHFLDKKTQIGNPNYTSFKEYQAELKELETFKYSDLEETYYPSTALTYTVIPYLFSGFGILVGKIFGASFIFSFYLGRLANLIIYAVMVFLSLRIIPMGKRVLFTVALLPTILFQAASFSADVVINAFSFFAFALIIKWMLGQKRVLIWQLCLFVLSCILVTASKMTYAPLFFLIFLLKKDNFLSKKEEWITKSIVLVIAAVAFLMTYAYGDLLGIAQWPVPGVDIQKQVLGILFNPTRYIAVILKTIILQGVDLLKSASIVLGYIGNLDTIIFVMIWLFLFFIAFFDINQKSRYLKKTDRLKILALCICSIGLSLTALYVTFTPLGKDVVKGFQGRYLIPVLFPFLFLFQRKSFVPKIKSETLNSIVIIFVGCISFYSFFFVVRSFYL